MRSPEIVVGVDGSAGSQTALLWAAAQAARRERDLVVVHAYDWRRPGSRMALGGEYAAAARQQAQAVVDASIADVREAAPQLTVRGEAVLGQAGAVLVAASRDAELVVVGSRGRDGFASLLLGSVSERVAAHASGPVVVVRGRPDASTGPVVVGADGSAAANAAIGVAFEEAAARGTSVLALRVSHPVVIGWGMGLPTVVDDPQQRHTIERDGLHDDVAAWREKYPDVPVECVVLDGQPAQVLADASATAQLVVVGTRGHGGFAGLLLGSVSAQLLHHAESPVLVTRG